MGFLASRRYWAGEAPDTSQGARRGRSCSSFANPRRILEGPYAVPLDGMLLAKQVFVALRDIYGEVVPHTHRIAVQRLLCLLNGESAVVEVGIHNDDICRRGGHTSSKLNGMNQSCCA